MENSNLKFQISSFGFSFRGRDRTFKSKINQDSFICNQNLGGIATLFGVFDGHGVNGHNVSNFIAKRLPCILSENAFNLKSMISIFGSKDNFSRSKMKGILEESLSQVAKETLENENIDCQFSGSTSIVLYLFQKFIFVSSIGDSRAIMGIKIKENWVYEQISKEHNLGDKFEEKRIQKFNGRIEPSRNQFGDFIGPLRVWHKDLDIPGLAMTRSVGDSFAKGLGVTDKPGKKNFKIDITCIDLRKECKFFVIASDGIWDVLTNDNVLQICSKLYQTMGPEDCSKHICNEALDRWKRVLFSLKLVKQQN